MIEDLKATRDALWLNLSELQAEKDRLFSKGETYLRSSLKEVQDEIFYLEMKPILPTIKNKKKADQVRAQLEVIKTRYPHKNWG